MIIHNHEQNSDEWYQARLGIPTTSAFSKLLTGKGSESTQINKYARALAYEIKTGESSITFEGNKYTNRGHELEPIAAYEYELETGGFTREVGFITNDDQTCGASPDRLIGDNGLLEIKCFEFDAHLEAMEHYHDTGEAMPERIQQIQGQLMISERNWCDLYHYHDKLPSFCVRVGADFEYHSKLKALIAKVNARRDEILTIINEVNNRQFTTTTAKDNEKTKLIMEL